MGRMVFACPVSPSQELAKVAAIAAALVEHERAQQVVVLGTLRGKGVRVSPWKQAARPRLADEGLHGKAP